MGDPAKYFLIEVPNYMGGQDGQLNSYLCLGQPGSHLPLYGEDLAWVVTNFADDTRQREPLGLGTGNPPPAESFPGDDTTLDPSLSQTDKVLTSADRGAESKLLHSKGGWRDHSDGNRITTTRGDKVEVIRGNYRMVVLGRRDPVPWTKPAPPAPGTVVDAAGGQGGYLSEQGIAGATDGAGALSAEGDNPDTTGNSTVDLQNAVSVDISGGLVDTETYGPDDHGDATDQTALATEYVWSQNSNKLWGWTCRTRTGQYGNSATDGNGKTISYTWVDEVWAFRGSPKPDPVLETMLDTPLGQQGVKPPNSWDPNNLAAQPLKTLWQQDWAETVYQETNASQIEDSEVTPSLVTKASSAGTLEMDTTSVGDTVFNTQTTGGGNITNVMNASGGMDNTTSSSGHMSNSMSSSNSICDVTSAQSFHSEIDAAILMISEIKLAILQSEIRLGIHLENHLGIHFENHFGLHVENHIGWHQQFKTASAEVKDIQIKSNLGTWMLGLINLGFGPPVPVAPSPTAAVADPSTATAAADAAPAAGVSGGGAATDLGGIGGLGVSTAPAATATVGASADYVIAGVISAGGLGALGYAAFSGKGSSSSSAPPAQGGAGSSKPASETPPLETQSETPAPEADQPVENAKKPGPWEKL